MQGWGIDYISSTCVIHCKDKKIKQYLIKEFTKNDIEWREWWNQGCHKSSYLGQFTINELPQTKLLAQTTVGIPFHLYLSNSQIQKIFKIINADFLGLDIVFVKALKSDLTTIVACIPQFIHSYINDMDEDGEITD